jgi:transcriptional regulator with XRE-family HTH domain
MDQRQTGYVRLVADNTKAPNRIRELREAQGLSQAELARQINVTPPALQKVEIGSRKLDQQWMRRIAKALGCDPADLLPPEDNPWSLTDEERALIDHFRHAKEEDQEKFLRVADVVLEYRAPEKDAA